jgi:hypothetical protein
VRGPCLIGAVGAAFDAPAGADVGGRATQATESSSDSDSEAIAAVAGARAAIASEQSEEPALAGAGAAATTAALDPWGRPTTKVRGPAGARLACKPLHSQIAISLCSRGRADQTAPVGRRRSRRCWPSSARARPRAPPRRRRRRHPRHPRRRRTATHRRRSTATHSSTGGSRRRPRRRCVPFLCLWTAPLFQRVYPPIATRFSHAEASSAAEGRTAQWASVRKLLRARRWYTARGIPATAEEMVRSLEELPKGQAGRLEYVWPAISFTREPLPAAVSAPERAVILRGPHRPEPVLDERGVPAGCPRHHAHPSEKDAKLAQKLGQLQLFIAAFPQECMDQRAFFGPT